MHQLLVVKICQFVLLTTSSEECFLLEHVLFQGDLNIIVSYLLDVLSVYVEMVLSHDMLWKLLRLDIHFINMEQNCTICLFHCFISYFCCG